MGTKILIIGGVAAGATAAARARRVAEDAEILLVERGPYVSFANCGLPYFISGDIAKRSKLLLQTPEGFDSRYGVKVRVNTEALEIDRKGKRVLLRGPEGEAWEAYDQLILAQGGNPVMPVLPGSDSPNVFKLWTVPDMDRLAAFLAERKPSSAAVIGGGFIGLEMAEAFHARGLATTVVELLPRVMPVMDGEFGAMIAAKLEEKGVGVRTGVGLKAILPERGEIELADGSRIPAGVVLMSVGVRPELALAKAAGLELGASGGLLVDEELRSSDPDIHAAGDMVEVIHKVSGRKVRVPLAGPANRQGRIAASNALGMRMKYRGALGTSVFKAFEATAASTGLTERAAREAGIDAGAAMIVKDDHASYFPGGKELALKLVYDRRNGRVLGAQAFGEAGVEKRIDVAAAALQGRLTVEDLAELDLAYAPPYSSANDPLNLAAFAAQNDLSGYSPLETAAALKAAMAAAREGGGKAFVLDVRNRGEYEKGHLAGAVNLPLDELRFELDSLPRGETIHVHCRSGYRSHLALRILRGRGFEKVVNVAGGFIAIQAEGGFDIEGE
ncbi:MAG TPA: FAD-dependent oxidoreductase [Spirochaetales bacterium]|nr:FAD-dependent oxidoreductase [Spirochaetales bacterium]HRZ64656.1 FAD-dependent oxidoreductase [Spirochaetia bacterium]